MEESELVKGCRVLNLHGLIDGNDVSTIHQISKFFNYKFTDLPRIMDELKKDCRKSNANLIIVMDDFHEFCTKNQFLLYNFFDLIQYVKYVLVIGITYRYDSIELLEKRVKSRMNHKIIDLKPPFQSLGQYLEFAKNLLDKDDVKFTKQFQRNLEIQYSKSNSIAQLRCCLLFNMRSKRATHKINQNSIQRCLEGEDEKIRLICNYLTHLEICVLLLAAKLIFDKDYKNFNINDLNGFANEIPKQIIPQVNDAPSKKHLFMAVGILIDYDLFVIEEKRSVQKDKLYLTDWTVLVLNVFRFHIEESLKRLDKNLPTGVTQLFRIQN